MDINDIFNYGLPKNILVTDDSIWNKKGNSKSKDLLVNANENPLLLMPDISTIKVPPDWNRIPSKNEKMSDEEFEKAIAELARADAERGAKIRDAAKGMQESEEIRIRMLTDYISVVSPDRKAAYEKVGGVGYYIYGSDGLELMQRGSDGKWQTGKFTEEELARASKFYEIYRQAYAEYEAENGQVPTAKTVDSYKTLTGYGAYNSYGASSAYNFWA